MSYIEKLFDPRTSAPTSTFWIRLMTGSVFFWEGLIKFEFANQGVGRFTKLGFPFPGVLAPSIASLEIVGGLLLIAGLLTRPMALIFIGQMIVAVLSTKISLFLGTYPLAYPPVPPIKGFWAVLHEVRSDWAQIATCIFLVLEGPGAWSLDAWRAEK